MVGDHRQLPEVCARHPWRRSHRAAICLPHRWRGLSRSPQLSLGDLQPRSTEDRRWERVKQGKQTLAMFQRPQLMLSISEVKGQELCPQSRSAFLGVLVRVVTSGFSRGDICCRSSGW